MNLTEQMETRSPTLERRDAPKEMPQHSPPVVRVENPLQLLQHALDKGIGPEQLGKMMDLVDRWKAGEAARQYAEAMNAVQAELPAIFKGDKGDKGQYAKLERIEQRIKPILSRHGFSVSCGERPEIGDATHAVLYLDVRHIGGHKERFEGRFAVDMTGPAGKPNKTEIQGRGSMISYARRYLTVMAFDLTLTGEDNDGAGEVKFLDLDQINELDRRLLAVKADRARFCSWVAEFTGTDIGGLQDIPVKALPKINEFLTRKEKS